MEDYIGLFMKKERNKVLRIVNVEPKMPCNTEYGNSPRIQLQTNAWKTFIRNPPTHAHSENRRQNKDDDEQ